MKPETAQKNQIVGLNYITAVLCSAPFQLLGASDASAIAGEQAEAATIFCGSKSPVRAQQAPAFLVAQQHHPVNFSGQVSVS